MGIGLPEVERTQGGLINEFTSLMGDSNLWRQDVHSGDQ